MIVQDIIKAIQTYETIIIHRHVRPDPDALGSQAGLKELILHSFPGKNVYIVGEEDSSLTFLTRMEEINDGLYEDALVIVCDTANTDRIDDDRYKLGKQLIKIDHHPNVDQYGDIQWVDTSASSTSEMIYELYLHGKDAGFQLNEEAARLIYAGIIGDTGRFLFPNTTSKTFHYAAELVKFNFNRETLYAGVYNTEENVARLKGYILQNFTISPNGVSSIILTQDILETYGVNPLETGRLVSILGDIEGILAWVIFVEEEDVIRVRLRSKGPVINEVAAKYNGGGHPLASGASITSWDDTEKVLADLERVCSEFHRS